MTRPDPHIAPDRCRIERSTCWSTTRRRRARPGPRSAPASPGAHSPATLVAEPSNVLTPAGFAERLPALQAHGIEVEVLDAGSASRPQGFGGLLAVGGASASTRPASPCCAGPAPSPTRPRSLFVGKGITFDTGGVCLKPGQGMWEMRADMAGAAACAGAMLALARRRSPAPAVAVLPLAENAIGAASYRPSDVLRMFDGTTVEVVDTDAEGRLVLADALAWALAGCSRRR